MASKIQQLISEHAEMKRKFQEQAQCLFKELTKEFFEKNPGVTAVVWSQYTPYFNDGEACVFSVNDPTFTNAPDPENVRWGEYDGEEENVWACENVAYVLGSDRKYYQELADQIRAAGGVDVDSCEELSKAICSSAMEDVMYEMFGDHARIIATRDGFDVDEYDHD